MVNPTYEDGSQNFEIERKWLISNIPKDIDLKNLRSEDVLQGYAIDNTGRMNRLRRKGAKWYKTHKVSTDDPLKRVEHEVEITEEQFLAGWPKTESRRVEKTRYYIDFNNHTIELDVFHGDNAGNMMAEVEFDTVEAAEAFEPPAWFGPEVTKDMHYTNSDIAEFGFPKDN